MAVLRKIDIVRVIVGLHPVFFLLGVYSGLRGADMGRMPGVVLLGALLGLAFFRVRARLNPDFKSAAGVIFLFAPLALCLLAAVDSELIVISFGSNFFWLFFLSAYLIAGAALYIKNNPGGFARGELYIIGLCVPFLIFALALSFISPGVQYSPDSYGYYDMSRRIFSDFGRVSVIRQYVRFTYYGISFPYLFPALIAVVDLLTGFGMLSGTVINILAALASFYLMLKISLRLCKSAVPGLIAALALFFNPEYLSEMINARAVPLSLLCALLALNIIAGVWLSGQFGRKNLFLLGLILGAGMVIRFDFFVLPALFGVVLLFVLRQDMLRLILCYAAGVLVFTSPWVVYSLAHFGTFWVSDNSGTLFLVTPQIPQRFFTPDEVVPDFFNDFSAWFASRQHIIMRGLASFFVVLSRPVELMLLLVTAGAGILAGGPAKNIRGLAVCVALVYLAKTMAILLVGYGDLRYHIEALMIVGLVLMCAFYAARADKRVWAVFIGLAFGVSLIGSVQPMLRASVQPQLLEDFINTDAFTPDFETREIERILLEDSGAACASDIRLFYIGGNIFRDPYRLGAYTDIKAFARISNINELRLLYLMRNYIRPDYIHALEGEMHWVDVLREHYLITKISGAPPLFRVEALPELAAGSIRASSVSDEHWYNGVGINAPIIVFRNTPENLAKLAGATGLVSGGVYLRVTGVSYDEHWIYAECAPDINIGLFAYPSEIAVMR